MASRVGFLGGLGLTLKGAGAGQSPWEKEQDQLRDLAIRTLLQRETSDIDARRQLQTENINALRQAVIEGKATPANAAAFARGLGVPVSEQDFAMLGPNAGSITRNLEELMRTASDATHVPRASYIDAQLAQIQPQAPTPAQIAAVGSPGAQPVPSYAEQDYARQSKAFGDLKNALYGSAQQQIGNYPAVPGGESIGPDEAGRMAPLTPMEKQTPGFFPGEPARTYITGYRPRGGAYELQGKGEDIKTQFGPTADVATQTQIGKATSGREAAEAPGAAKKAAATTAATAQATEDVAKRNFFQPGGPLARKGAEEKQTEAIQIASAEPKAAATTRGGLLARQQQNAVAAQAAFTQLESIITPKMLKDIVKDVDSWARWPQYAYHDLVPSSGGSTAAAAQAIQDAEPTSTWMSDGTRQYRTMVRTMEGTFQRMGGDTGNMSWQEQLKAGLQAPHIKELYDGTWASQLLRRKAFGAAQDELVTKLRGSDPTKDAAARSQLIDTTIRGELKKMGYSDDMIGKAMNDTLTGDDLKASGQLYASPTDVRGDTLMTPNANYGQPAGGFQLPQPGQTVVVGGKRYIVGGVVTPQQ